MDATQPRKLSGTPVGGQFDTKQGSAPASLGPAEPAPYYAMFTDEGNRIVHDAFLRVAALPGRRTGAEIVDAVTADVVMFGEREGVDVREVYDTAVREALWVAVESEMDEVGEGVFQFRPSGMSSGCQIDGDTAVELWAIHQKLSGPVIPASVETAFGSYATEVGQDEDGRWFSAASFMFAGKQAVYAELEDGTYGTLRAVRVLLGESEPRCQPSPLQRSSWQRPTDFDEFLDELSVRVQNGERAARVEHPWGGDVSVDHVSADDDEEGIGYAVVRFELPPGMLAEIDGGTFGRMQGVRIFYDGDGLTSLWDR